MPASLGLGASIVEVDVERLPLDERFVEEVMNPRVEEDEPRGAALAIDVQELHELPSDRDDEQGGGEPRRP